MIKEELGGRGAWEVDGIKKVKYVVTKRNLTKGSETQ